MTTETRGVDAPQTSPNVRHVVMADLHSDCTTADVDLLVGVLNALRDVVPGILSMTAGEAQKGSAGHRRICLVSDHVTWDDLDSYKAHPEHLRAASLLRERTESVIAADFEVSIVP